MKSTMILLGMLVLFVSAETGTRRRLKPRLKSSPPPVKSKYDEIRERLKKQGMNPDVMITRRSDRPGFDNSVSALRRQIQSARLDLESNRKELGIGY
jgi:hypothetical protein